MQASNECPAALTFSDSSVVLWSDEINGTGLVVILTTLWLSDIMLPLKVSSVLEQLFRVFLVELLLIALGLQSIGY